MEKIYIDLVQTSNFKFQVSFTNIIHFFLLQRYLTRSIIENSSKNIFWKEFFFMENSINIPTRGIIRSRAQSSVSFILDQRTPSKASRKKLSQPSFLLDRYYSLEFENVTEGLKKKKNKNKNKKKTKHLWNGNLWYASRKLMLTSAATTQKSFVATPLRSFLSRSFQPPFPVMARVSWNHPYFQR